MSSGILACYVWKMDYIDIFCIAVQFEGSLGRLTSSSVHNPRQIIDVASKPTQNEEDPKARELKQFKQLLIHVEKVYTYLEYSSLMSVMYGSIR